MESVAHNLSISSLLEKYCAGLLQMARRLEVDVHTYAGHFERHASWGETALWFFQGNAQILRQQPKLQQRKFLFPSSPLHPASRILHHPR